MADRVKVPLLNDLAPDGFFYGGHYIVEFDSDSLWYETSLTLAALALKQGLKTEYHVFQHFPGEAIEAFSRLGVDAEKMEKDGLLNIWDSYTDTLKYETEKKKLHDADQNMWMSTSDKPLNMTRSAARWGETAKAGLSEKDKRWLHIDDNTGIILQYNDEKEVIDAWRTGMVPYAMRARESPHFLAFVKGGASDTFYTKYEALCDGIIDMKAEEVGGKIESYIRVRTLRGKTFDSSWHRLAMGNNGEVRLVGEGQQAQKRRLAAIMFTDMVGYTALSQKDESLSLALVEEQRRLIRPILAKHNGREVKTIGDAFFVEFPSALDAVRCAYEIQRAVKEFDVPLPEDKRVHLRIGLHLGDVVESNGDISGDAVNVASRVEPLADAGGICLTREVYSQVANKFELPLKNLGPKNVKNIAAPLEVYRVVMPWEEGSVPPAKFDKLRVAILPFSNISPDPNDAYIADGMTEELISIMSKITGLSILARTSVMRYKGGERNIEEIAKELKSGTIVEGSVRKAGAKVRITVQVIDAESSAHLWSESYDREMQDVFAVQADISQAVANSLKVTLLEEERIRIRTEPTKNSEAHTLYLKGVYITMNEYDRKSAMLNCVGCLKRATELDPKYASAYAYLADAYLTLYAFRYLPPDKVFPLAEEAVAKALDLDPNLPEAHRSLGMVKYFKDKDWEGALEECKEAVDLSPNDAWNHGYYALCLLRLGRLEEAEAEARSALDLAPVDRVANHALASVLYRRRKFEELVTRLKAFVELDADSSLLFDYLGLGYFGLSQFDKAAEEFQKAVDLQRTEGHLSNWATACARAGRVDEARKILSELNEISTRKHVSVDVFAQIHVALGESDEALKLLEKAIKEHDTGTVHGMQYEPMYDGLRSEARFIALLEKIPSAERIS